MIAGIVLDNPMENLFLLIVDRDGDNSGHELAATFGQLRREATRTICSLASPRRWKSG
jgi:hypothetical protein